MAGYQLKAPAPVFVSFRQGVCARRPAAGTVHQKHNDW